MGIAYDCLKAREEARDENVVLKQGKDSMPLSPWRGKALPYIIDYNCF